MPSQYSSHARRSVEDAIAREIEREEIENDLALFMAESASMRAKVAQRRVLESASDRDNA